QVCAGRASAGMADRLRRSGTARLGVLRVRELAAGLATGRLGAIEPPGIAEYAIAMGWSVARSEPTGDGEWRRRVSIYEGLLADPGLLDDEVWRLFTVADAAWRLSEEWANALARLAAEGDLDRGRLIDATLSAFTSDFRPNRVGWYLIMHERLRPSLDEMAARAGHYLRQLQATAKPAVTLGQRAVGRLADARR